MQFHMWPSVVFTDIGLKCGQACGKNMTKNSQANRSLRTGPWEKTFPFFGSHLLALISRNVGTKGHLRKEIILLKYQFFRFRPKSGGQVELIDWRKVQGFDVGGLWYCSFYHPLGRLQNWTNLHRYICLKQKAFWKKVPNLPSPVWPVDNS